MKPDTRKKNGQHGTVAAIVSLFIIIAIVIGLMTAYAKLRELWLEQCALNDSRTQISVSAGKMVKADAIKDVFGLTNGANLAKIDFAAKREEVLRKYPTVRSLSIERHLPDRVSIAIIEREPVVRMNVAGGKSETGRVADAGGVVFPCRRGTSMLPVIRESSSLPPTACGKPLVGRARAALRLIDVSLDPAFSSLGILEVDISKKDCLSATLGNYSTALIAWDGMDGDEDDLERIREKLKGLVHAIKARGSSDNMIWDATLPGEVFARNQGFVK